MSENHDISQIKSWRSIVTLIVFVLASKYLCSGRTGFHAIDFLIDIIVLFPFHVPIFVPRPLANAVLDVLSHLRVIPPRQGHDYKDDQSAKVNFFVRLKFPMNFVTAPLIADIFLLAISAIGRQEVHDGTIGANNISPIDIMIFFLTLAYIAISIDASGLIRFLAFKVLQKGGGVGHRLFFYLYAFFFSLGSFIGNDPIILSGTAFLAYMTRVSSNIVHPRAWIHSQFAVANIASAILVSSNPTNLVLAGAFKIKFIDYTANMIVPVVITTIVLFPFLLYIIFADESLIPLSIKMHELSEEAKAKKPVNPNIPKARGKIDEQESKSIDNEQGKLLSLEEIMNPFVDKGGAAFGAVVMAATLITVLALNAASQGTHENPVFWVTLPAASVMLCWDLAFGWIHRHETRGIARKGQQVTEKAEEKRVISEVMEANQANTEQKKRDTIEVSNLALTETRSVSQPQSQISTHNSDSKTNTEGENAVPIGNMSRLLSFSGRVPKQAPSFLVSGNDDVVNPTSYPSLASSVSVPIPLDGQVQGAQQSTRANITLQGNKHSDRVFSSHSPSSGKVDEENRMVSERVLLEAAAGQERGRSTLISLAVDAYRWLQETFPTVAAVMAHLPLALVPFAFAMFVLVQALVTKGWVPLFAQGWDHWVDKTGTVGSIGGMAFLSVILCNVSFYNLYMATTKIMFNLSANILHP